MSHYNAQKSGQEKSLMYDRSTMRVIILACVAIVLSVVLTSAISYFITQRAIVDKLKSRDMVYIVESIAAKIDGRLERAKEVSLILAKDPTLLQWVAGKEEDERLGDYTKAKIKDIAQQYDYSNAFLASDLTKNYWVDAGTLVSILLENAPEDTWFFSALQSNKKVALNIDFDKALGDTFVFANALIEQQGKPIGVTGVALNLKDMAREFKSYKFSEQSNLWLIDRYGKIYLSENIDHIGMYLNDFIAPDIVDEIIQAEQRGCSHQPHVIEYHDKNGTLIDLAYQVTKSTDWKLVFQIPRSESIAILGNIKMSAAIASLISLLLIIFIFYFISHHIANPLQRAVLLTQVMERQVQERTHEIAEKNNKIMESIDYAQRIQQAMLPPPTELSLIFREYFIIWKPRDVVGGDFYWARKIDEDKRWLAVIDCTGHGVPGAFMTMTVNSILNHLVDEWYDNPAAMLGELNRRVKDTLHRNESDRMIDDGLDIGICYVEGKERLVFAGAKLHLYVKRAEQVHRIQGDKKSIGYRSSVSEMVFTNHVWNIQEKDRFYLTTDGYIDQNGGEKDYAFGRSRFLEALTTADHSLPEEQAALEEILEAYMGEEPQRDDITVVGFFILSG